MFRSVSDHQAWAHAIETSEVRHGLSGDPAGTFHRRGRDGLLVVQLAGAGMFCAQQRDSQAGAGHFHDKLVLLQPAHHCAEHAVHAGRDRKGPAAFRGLPVSRGQLPRHVPDGQCDAEHGGAQHRPLDRRGLPTQLLEQDAVPGRAADGVLRVAPLARLLRGGAAALLARLQPRVRVLHLAPERRELPHRLRRLHRGLPRRQLHALAARVVRDLLKSAQSRTLSLQKDRHYHNADALLAC